MKQTIYFAAILICGLLVIACNNGRSYNPPPTSNQPGGLNLPDRIVPNSNQPVQNTQPAVTPQPVQPQPVATTGSSAGLNPEHGKPGHRCDIPVGSPLDSKPIQTTVTPGQKTNTASTNPVTITPTTTPATQPKTAPGMNPPHGQPGHRCDIAVGAPLNSKPPATTVSQPTPLLPIPPPTTPVKSAEEPVKVKPDSAQ